MARIQAGDSELLNQFITDYQPYIAKVTSRFCNRYVNPHIDDEFSIALSAFNEAVEQYNPTAGKSFLGFAETVIRRRLIDYLRKEQRHSGQIPISAFDYADEDDHVINPVEVKQAVDAYRDQLSVEERRGEILDLTRCLHEFEIGFDELVRISPRHTDSRCMLMGIGVKLADQPLLMRTLLTKKRLPVKELTEQSGLSRKTIERNRKYIITVAIIHNGPYPYLREYLNAGLSNEMRVTE
ncbi:RNA polymerase sigma factor SigI [Gorillibacterium massiliense]|uniref:RNA polymerase sigma factor SigI n=1 Tax=Gorillibacterium massiliense TaxID=1280390 RepID=UPI001EE1C284|nr:RNA polymerase sigma factor SigI [Gorillibacterium massiliense]